MTDSNLRKALFEEQFKQIEENLTPFGFMDEGPTERPIPVVEDNDLWFNDGRENMNQVMLNWLEKSK